MTTTDFNHSNDPVDLSDYSTAAGAAKRAHKAIRALAEDMGQNPDSEVMLYSPEETHRYRDMHSDAKCWTLSWEAGPFEWAVGLIGGDSIYANEFSSYGLEPEIVGFYAADGWSAECYYSFDIQFFNE